MAPNAIKMQDIQKKTVLYKNGVSGKRAGPSYQKLQSHADALQPKTKEKEEKTENAKPNLQVRSPRPSFIREKPGPSI